MDPFQRGNHFLELNDLPEISEIIENTQCRRDSSFRISEEQCLIQVATVCESMGCVADATLCCWGSYWFWEISALNSRKSQLWWVKMIFDS